MRVFFDTNVLVYAFASNAGDRRRQAVELFLAAVANDEPVISTQVLSELVNVLLRKAVPPMSASEVERLLERLAPLEVVEPSRHSVLDALRLMQREQLSWWDALVVETAIRSGCKILYTEDMQHGRVYESTRLINPFR